MRYQIIIEFNTPNDYYGGKVTDTLMKTLSWFMVEDVALVYDGPDDESPVAGDPRLYAA